MKLIVSSLYEEGFKGDVSFAFARLPEGVEALPGAQLNDDRAPAEVTENSETIAPKRQQTTLLLQADANAPITSLPTVARLYCRPILNGQPGASLLVREVPVMVVAGPQADPHEKGGKP